MWQKFTQPARQVILLGQEEAAKMDSGYVGTEHLLLGLVSLDNGITAHIFREKSVTLEKVRQEIEKEIRPESQPVSEPKLTRNAKRTLEFATEEAKQMRHNYIGPEHLLLAFLREKDGLAATMLGKLGLNLETARSQVMEYLEREAVLSLAAISSMSLQTQEKDGTLLQRYLKPELKEKRPIPEYFREMDAQWAAATREMKNAVDNDDYELAVDLREQANEIESRFSQLAQEWKEGMRGESGV